MKRIMLIAAMVAQMAPVPLAPAMADERGMIARPSKHSVPVTLDRLTEVLQSKGITVFARIDHSGEAAKAGLSMPPTQLLIFGNPKAGTPLMVAAPSLAIDLPLKVLAWQDAQGQVWAGYNGAEYLAERHGLTAEQRAPLAAVGALVDAALQ
ncbi:DUF302 domain-containing protein [Desertibaculum subflavum]|uniref:DUF302 domain-containing protein n=1 Tax=Desertibaculum subflavum TaxID=2268458 RepID=UPI0034D1E54E